MGWQCDTSTPGDPQNNSAAERTVGTIKDSIRTNLYQSGLNKSWWHMAGYHAAMAVNMSKDNTGDIPLDTRYGGKATIPPRIPFGALVSYMPNKHNGRARTGFHPVLRPGLFLGYVMHTGGKWSQDYTIVDLDLFRGNPDAKPSDAQQYVHRTSRVDFQSTQPLFPLRAAHDKADTVAARCNSISSEYFHEPAHNSDDGIKEIETSRRRTPWIPYPSLPRRTS